MDCPERHYGRRRSSPGTTPEHPSASAVSRDQDGCSGVESKGSDEALSDLDGRRRLLCVLSWILCPQIIVFLASIDFVRCGSCASLLPEFCSFFPERSGRSASHFYAEFRESDANKDSANVENCEDSVVGKCLYVQSVSRSVSAPSFIRTTHCFH